MKILYIITQSEGGGAQKYVLALAKHFKGMVAAGNESKKLFLDAANLQLTTYNLQHLKRNINPWHDLRAIFEIRKLVKATYPDIVHLNSSKAGFLGSLACIKLKTKVVFTAHGFIFNEPMPALKKHFYILLEKIASRFRDFIIAVSKADRQTALKYNIISENKIKIIYNGIPNTNFYEKNEAKLKLGLPQDKKIIGLVANPYPTKGVDIFKYQAKTFPIQGTYVAVIGTSSNEPIPENIGKDIGFKEDAFKYIKAFDVLEIPSRKEGFPYVALEAMQAGVPIVASDVGGIKEAIDTAGILVEPENPKALADASAQIINNDQIKNQLSERGLERSKIFTEEKMLSETENVYKQILSLR